MRTREFLRRLHAGGLAGCLLSSGLAAPVSANPEAPWPVDTQPGGRPTPPTATAPAFQLSPGFEIRLAAAEPDVRQPIALAYDHRGRLWVAECYSYAGSDFTAEARDRIVIFEDRDGDGVFDSRRIFHDQLNRLTGLTLGFGGVWVATAPTVAFIPDRDGDDRPDGPAEPVLDGFTLRAEHNSVNGLTWGPDGWLYGRHDLEYLLLNLIDPNTTIPADYRLAVVKLKDGQVLSGTLAATTADPLVLRTLTEEHSLPRASVENVDVLPVSLMPAGLLDDLEPTAARDLIAYLMTGAAPSP